VPLDLDLDVGVDAAGDGMGAVGVEDAPAAWVRRLAAA
jgi:hypothetical protein